MAKIKSISINKILRLTALCSVFALLVMIVLLAIDYKNYKDLMPSRFFGSQDSYSQNQSLYFDDIKVTVSEIEHTRKWVMATSAEECNTVYPPKLVKLESNIFFTDLDGDGFEDVNSYGRRDCIEALDIWKSKKNVVVHYFIENLRSEPISISSYSAKIEGAEGIKDNKPNPRIAVLLANQSRYANFWVEAPINANDLALVISKDGKKKQIRLTMPDLKASIIR